MTNTPQPDSMEAAIGNYGALHADAASATPGKSKFKFRVTVCGRFGKDPHTGVLDRKGEFVRKVEEG